MTDYFDGLEATGYTVLNEPEHEYRAERDHLSASSIKVGFSKASMLAMWEAQHVGSKINENAARDGSAVHCAVLEPTQFGDRYVVAACDDRRSKKALAAAAEEFPDKIVITRREAQMYERLTDAVHSHSEAAKSLEAAQSRELSCYAVDGGVKLKCRIDAYDVESGTLYDLKTTGSDVDRASVAKACNDYGYHIQAAHYLHVARCAGLKAEAFKFIFVSKSTHRVGVFHLAAEDLELGEEIRRQVTDDYAEFLRDTEGQDRLAMLSRAGYGGGVVRLPVWAHRKFEQYMERR